MDAKTFGAFLARVRREQGLTQAELAEQLHVTDKAVSRWERGVGLPDINTLEPLADALGLSLADLMHCHDPGQGAPAAPVPLEDFFSMLRRQHTVDWHSVRVAMLCLSVALALWGMLTCPGSIAVHWHALNDGSLQSDGWMLSWLIFPLSVGVEFFLLELWNSFEQNRYVRQWDDVFFSASIAFAAQLSRFLWLALEVLCFCFFGFLMPCAEFLLLLLNGA